MMIKTNDLQAVNLDVTELEAPEPMRQILLALAALSHGQCLIVYHRKNPVPLYQKLTELGFVYRVDIDHKLNESAEHGNNQIKTSTSASCEDLAVVIKIAFKADESVLAMFTELDAE